MATITSALKRIDLHREVVPIYYHRSTGSFIVAGLQKTNGGAVVIDDHGRIGAMFHTKRDALASITHN